MEEKTMSPVEALEDFFEWALSPENKKTFIGRQRHYIKMTKANLLAGEKIGLRRIKSVLGLAPGRYEFHETVFVTKKVRYPTVPDQKQNEVSHHFKI